MEMATRERTTHRSLLCHGWVRRYMALGEKVSRVSEKTGHEKVESAMFLLWEGARKTMSNHCNHGCNLVPYAYAGWES